MENWKIVVCPKCHKEFKDEILKIPHTRICPHCKQIQTVYVMEFPKRNNNNQRENPSNNGSEDSSI